MVNSARVVPTRNTSKNQAAKSREQGLGESRKTHAENPPVDQWKPPSTLESPPPRDGYVQRWIRYSIRGNEDQENAMKKFREGWSPRDIGTIPVGFHTPTINHGQFSGFIGVEGMVLCEMPVKVNRQRTKYYQDRNIQARTAAESNIFKDIPASQMYRPDTKRSSETETGRRVEPETDND